MKRTLGLLCLTVLVLNLAGSAIGDSKRRASSQADHLALLLPAADAVVTIDVKRAFSTALPRVLNANQPLLQKINGKIDLMKERTGIDIRQFDQMAAGVAVRQVSSREYDTDPVIIARGQMSSGALVGAAKVATNGKYREEKEGDKVIYVFSAKDLAEQAKKSAPVSASPDTLDKFVDRLSGELAMTAIDNNTIAFGDLALVRQAVSASRKPMSNDLLSLLGKKDTSVMNFAAKVPNGMSAFLPLDNDELGKNIDSIRYLYGSVDVVADAVAMNITARTLQNAQATALLETLEGLQLLGKAFLGSSKGADKKVYARMIENAKFSAKANEVMVSLQVPQSDIDILLAGLK